MRVIQWLVLFALLLGIIVIPERSGAQSEISDFFGVRSNADPTSSQPNLREFNNSLILDVTLTESSGEFDNNSAGGTPLNDLTFDAPYIAVPDNPMQVRVNNGAILNLGVTGYMYLTESGSTTPSDRISLVATQTIGASNLITYTITLDSDIFTDNPAIPHTPATLVAETGLIQDMSALFTTPTDPTHPGKTVSDNGAIPFHVIVASDSTPEPNGFVLLAGAGVGFLVFRQRQRRRRS
jgi:hypothetical protein